MKRSTSTTAPTSPCCPLPPGVSPLPTIAAKGEREDESSTRFARRAHALSDPIRLGMLEVMTQAQTCCRPATVGAKEGRAGAGSPAGSKDTAGATPAGVCVCELQSLHGLAQSKVSYHLKVLREAGLVREERRGKWSFYAVEEQAAREFADDVRLRLGL